MRNILLFRKDHRKFMLNSMSKIGLGKKDVMDEIIEEEVEALKDIMVEELQTKGSIFSQRR